MTPLLNWIASRLGFKADRSERYIALARLAILWERVWPALWPASGVLGLFVAAALFGVLASIPSWLHGLLLLGVFAGAGALLHRNLKKFQFPGWEEGARRVERDSLLVHRPITEGHDRLAAGDHDPWTRAVWRAHLRRLLERIANLRVALPAPGLGSRDPYALRFVVLLLIAAGFAVAGSDWNRRLAFAFTPDTGAGTSKAMLDAWINPPAYTGEAPIYLQRTNGGDGPLAVPAGSELVLRVHEAAAPPRLLLDPEADGVQPNFTGEAGEYGAGARLLHNSDVRVLADGRLLGRWHITTIPDTPPVIAFAQPPSRTERDALKIVFTAADDYGVTSARAIIRPIAANAHAVLSIDLPLAATSARTLIQTVYRDLTDEPLAGVDVEIVLEAKDGAGQTGHSRPARIRLPARVFTNPLARALIEQRQTLAVAAPDAREKAERTLDALALAPDRFYNDQPNVYLAIRAAYWSVVNAHDASDIAGVQQLLWDTAVALEQGGLLSAAAQLRQLQQLLTQALAQGAPQDVIDALLERYRNALARYLQALAAAGPQKSAPSAPNAQTLRTEDLDAMLKAIQQMSQTGSRDAAAAALAMLENMIENLHVTQGGAPGDKALGDAIQGLSDLIGRQRQLLDKSFRQGQGAGDPKDGGGRGLAQSQGTLRQDLDKITRGLSDSKKAVPHSLGKAGHDMGEAQNQLGSNAFDSAGQAQKNALDALRDAAGELAKTQLKESGQGSGQIGEGQNDPLGREQGQSGWGADGGGTKIPDRDALQRARSILEELRRRAAERGRPKEELDYYDRLLKEF
ncbi:MAG: TIGR02302 family protein [Rhizomicrobium sp.]